MQTSSSKETVVYHARCECHEGTVTQVSIASCTSFFLQFFIKKLGQSLCGVIICELCWVHHCSLWPQPTERIASTDLIFSCSLFAFLSPVSSLIVCMHGSRLTTSSTSQAHRDWYSRSHGKVTANFNSPPLITVCISNWWYQSAIQIGNI